MGRHEFKIGDHVRLRANGRRMIVDVVIDEPDRSVTYVCVWFFNEEKQRGSFKGAELELLKWPPDTVP